MEKANGEDDGDGEDDRDGDDDTREERRQELELIGFWGFFDVREGRGGRRCTV